MSKALDDLLTQLPQWLGKFTQSLTHPSQVLNEQLAMASTPQTDGKPEAKPVPDGVSFLILSFAVAAGVSIAFPVPSMAPLEAGQAEGALTQSAAVLRNLFVFLAAAALLHGGSKLLGNRQAFAGFFGAMARFGGVTLVLLALAGALTNVGMADPVVARNWQQLRQVAEPMGPGAQALLCLVDPKTGQLPAGMPASKIPLPKPEELAQAQALFLDTLTRPMFLIAAGLETACLLALSLWLGWVWWRYLRVSGLSRARALAASAVGSAGLGGGYLLLTLIYSGQMSSQLMQTCS